MGAYEASKGIGGVDRSAAAKEIASKISSMWRILPIKTQTRGDQSRNLNRSLNHHWTALTGRAKKEIGTAEQSWGNSCRWRQ